MFLWIKLYMRGFLGRKVYLFVCFFFFGQIEKYLFLKAA